MNIIKYYRDAAGNYLGAFVGTEEDFPDVPAGAIEVAAPPAYGKDKWIGEEWVSVIAVPQSVTPLQATRALFQSSFLDAVEAAVAAADRETQLAWAKATAFERNSPFVLGMQTALGWTDEQLDSLFILAATL